MQRPPAIEKPTMIKVCDFYVHGTPCTKGSLIPFKVPSTGKLIVTEDFRGSRGKRRTQWMRTIAAVGREYHADPITDFVEVELIFFFHQPKSNKQPYPGRRQGDLDKLARCVFDSIQTHGGKKHVKVRGSLIEDDSQIVSFGSSCKRWTGGFNEDEGVNIAMWRLI